MFQSCGTVLLSHSSIFYPSAEVSWIVPTPDWGRTIQVAELLIAKGIILNLPVYQVFIYPNALNNGSCQYVIWCA